MNARPFKLKIQQASEAIILSAVLTALRYHPQCAWAERVNSGAAWLKGKGGKLRPVRFHTIQGCSDVLGQLRDGRLLAIETKKPGEALTDDQLAFLERVRLAGGVCGVARSVQDALDIVNQATSTQRMVCV